MVKAVVIEPGSVLGVLGGGQLGAMFTMAACRVGYRVAVWDPDPDAPAHRIATHSFPAPFTDQHSLERFADLVSVVTYEWENIPAELCRVLEQRRPVRPSSAVLSVIQDRLKQKGFLASKGFPVPPFASLTVPDQLSETIRQVGYPVLCKTATSGYDGKGQWRITRESDVREVEHAISESARPGIRWIVESLVPFERELSILVVRGADGQSCTYPMAENEHEEGILRITKVPAPGSSTVAERAAALAIQVVDRLEGVGVFCLEMFQLPSGELLINEIAPRPHNSGHYTLDACSVSQFEQQVRAICGMPLGEVRLLSPAVMLNLIGDDASFLMKSAGCRTLLDIPGAVLHLYGKRVIRPRRKMGHVMFLGETLGLALDHAKQFRDGLASGSTLSA
ncbi:MAG: 5-(carboxyamino)imidazole ribonucleotide synthase [Nitrospiraceae bacterium]|nr:MAG: 5-(carboxyamino)imidazole ribonucleotide synthase [Nitrospiraceae bacterium]